MGRAGEEADDLDAAVVGAEDFDVHGFESCFVEGFGHGDADGVFGLEADGHDGGSCATEKGSDSTRLLSCFEGSF